MSYGRWASGGKCPYGELAAGQAMQAAAGVQLGCIGQAACMPQKFPILCLARMPLDDLLGDFREVRKCEKPLYTVIRPLGSRRQWWDGKSPAELRQYAPMLIAQVAGASVWHRPADAWRGGLLGAAPGSTAEDAAAVRTFT